ncbi:hypothetical protein Agub_g8892 [Astrephomene gubernaculifera]|uniref:Uncharacterized protein n=1 Tax=Astrephomene gubernaculifera TaxID=47775 RepID=A0AAD3HNN0_9CHLO|nr:hypothetical protein Agub_g8892 [Astrephomene gubernaculifera]
MAAGTDAGAERRVVATGAAAAVRLYGALYGKAGEDAGADHAVAGDIGASTGGEEAAHAARPLLQGLLLRLLDAACELIRVRNFSTAAEILRGMLQALLPPSLRPLVLVTSGGNGGGGSCTSGQAAAAAPATAAEKEEEERLGTQFGWNSSSSSGSDGSNFLLLRSLGQVTAALVAGLLVSGGLASTPSTPPALLPRDVRQPLAVHLDEGAEAATEGPMWGEKQQGYYYHDDQQAWGAASGSGMAGTYNDSSSGRSSLQYQGQGQGGSRMHGALRERPVDALATDEHAALCTALRVWGGLMGQRQVCTCRREGGGATATAGVLGHHAEACDACAVRPGGPLLAVMEAAESLLHAEAGLFSGACTDTFCTSSGTPQLSYTSVGMQLDTGPFGAAHAAVMLHGGFECGTGLEQRSIRLLSALRFALTAAIKTNPTTTSTSPTTQESVPRPDRCSLSLDKLERMRCLLQQLDGTGIPDLTRLGCISGDWKEDTPQDVVGDEGLEPAGADVAVREEATTAEELAEAEAILEECLACIRTASSGASLSIPAWE